MGLFPKIQSPCPYKGSLTDILDGDVCRLCKREVFDLTAMSDSARRDFLKQCAGEVCVSYRVLRPALALAAIGAAAMPLAAAAAADVDEANMCVDIIVGGLRAPESAEWVRHTTAHANLPELPVVYEDEPTMESARFVGSLPVSPTSSQAADRALISAIESQPSKPAS